MRDGVPLNLLGLDTSTEACSVALSIEGRIVADRFEQRERGHAERLVPLVLELMSEAQVGFETLDAITVTIGPGSFTGVRIGLSAAHGFALAGNLPLIGIGTLEALAAGIPAKDRAGMVTLATVLALPGEVYAQAFDDRLAPLTAPAACTFVEAIALVGDRPTLVVGTAAEEICAAAAAPRIKRAEISPWPQATALVTHVAALAGTAGLSALADRLATPLYVKAPGLGSTHAPASLRG